MDRLHEAGAHGIERFYGTAVVVLPMRLNQSLGQPLEAARVERQRCWRVLILECACLGGHGLVPCRRERRWTPLQAIGDVARLAGTNSRYDESIRCASASGSSADASRGARRSMTGTRCIARRR